MRRPAPLPRDLLERASIQEGLISWRQGIEAGLSAPQLRCLTRAGELTAVVRGVFEIPAAIPVLTTVSAALDHRRRRAAVLGLLAYGPRAVATGLAALVLAGVQGAPADMRPEVTIRGGDPRAPIPGIRLRRIPVRQIVMFDDFPLIAPEQALAQAVADVDRMTAVMLMDSAMNRRLVNRRGLARAHELVRGHRGAARTHRWWTEADGRAASPAETAARLTCANAGHPPDEIQLVILDGRGGFLARVEFGWRLPDGRWLLVEVDGLDFHTSRPAVLADFHRQNRVITAGTLVRRYSGSDALRGRLATEVGQILDAASWRPGRWTPVGEIRLATAA